MVRFSGAVLTGGKSSRFGSDKAIYQFRGKPLLEWAWQSLDQAKSRVLIGGSYFDLPHIPDLAVGADVMGGIYTALEWCPEPWLGVMGCDQPFFSPTYWHHLARFAGDKYKAVVPHSEAGFEPLGALYKKDTLELFRSKINEGNFKVQDIFKEVPCLTIPKHELEKQFGSHLFLNANRIEELSFLD